jgi:hypothetical protein
MDVLSILPRDQYHVRQSLFTLPVPLSLSVADHEQFWPLIDNVYSIQAANDVSLRSETAALPTCDYVQRLEQARASAPFRIRQERLLPRTLLLATLLARDLRLRDLRRNRRAGLEGFSRTI